MNKEKAQSDRIESLYGRTQSGNQPINLRTLDDLVQFGYTEKMAAIALVRSENDFNLALDVLQSGSLDDLDNVEDLDEKMDTNDSASNDLLLSQLVSMGYDVNVCRLCLTAFKNSIPKSIEFLCENKDNLRDWASIESKLNDIIRRKTERKLNMSPDELEKAENARKLVDDLKKEIADDDEAYLDFNLDDDTLFINKYLSLLNS